MEVSNRKVVTAGHLHAPKNVAFGADVKCKPDTSTVRDRRQFNLRELNESDRTTMIEDTVEKSVSVESKQTVECVLAQVRQLSPVEKLLLYLKLPNGRSTVDPLRQHMNPLGSRLEIHHTITWIKTHLQEDPEVSLPKQDVYEQYLEYCQVNSVKPLSTADFGKVMKQVYPDVRPRRLGTRGHSRYCYAGLRKRIRLAPPLLPDLGQSENCALEDNGGGKMGSPERTLLVAVSLLIREWAEKMLGLRFSSLQELACHLVQSMSVNSQSTAALTILSALTPPIPRSSGNSRPTSSAPSLNSESGTQFESSNATSRPASETPRSTADRDHKRKIHDDSERTRLKTPESKVRGKRTKHRSSSSPSETHAGRRSIQNKSLGSQPITHCDNSDNNHVYSGVPYSSTKEGHADMQNNNTPITNGTAIDPHLMHSLYSEVLVPEPSNNMCDMNGRMNTDENALKPDGAAGGKLPIPRLPKASKPAMQNYILLPPPSQQQPPQTSQSSQKQKYKLIKPKPYPELEKAADDDSTRIQAKRLRNNNDSNTVNNQNGCLKNDDAIIGCLEKDALDDYLHGGNNSQEQEEELMQYFPQQIQNNSVRMDVTNNVDKISQLRLLLERNLNQEAAGKVLPYQNGLSAAASLSLLSQRNQQKQSSILPSLLSNQHNVARRVSFEVPGDPDSAANSVPPSPNTKQRFSFTPISPRPYSPTKSTSANASPFVSPRNTPVPRLKMNSQQHCPYMPPVNPQPGLQTSPALSVKPNIKSGMSRTMVRSMSVNSEASMSPFQSVKPQSFMPTACANKAPLDMVGQVHLDVKPDINSLQNMNHFQHGNPYLNADMSAHHSSNNTLAPLHLSRSQFPVSMSAPQSPVVHTSKSTRRGSFNLRKEVRAHSFDMDGNNALLHPAAKSQTGSMQFTDNSCYQQQQNVHVSDKYSQEISDLFPDDMMSLPPMSSMSSFRSQSVPLRRMVNSAAVSPMPATALPSPLYGAGHSHQGVFNFNHFTPSNGSSVAPTPVPSEMADFGIESDSIMMNNSVQPSPVPSNVNDFNNDIMRDGGQNCDNNTQVDNMGAESLNPELLNEMFRMLEEGKNDLQQAPPSGFSQSYPNTPLPFKADPDSTLRADPLLTAFRLHHPGGSDNGCSEEHLTLGSSSAGPSSADPVLSELNNMANTASSEQDMSILLEEAPSSFMTDDLECEISQLAREVADTSQ